MRLLTTIIVAMFLGFPAMAQALERGIYFGCADSGGDMVPVATTIEENGTILSGAYLFVEPDGTRTRGWLKNGIRELSGDIVFVWEDKYGKGRLTIRPEPDGTGFSGVWSDPTGEGSHIWWGKRGNKVDLETMKCGERSQT